LRPLAPALWVSFLTACSYRQVGLSEHEREEAFAEVPEMEALRLNRNIAFNLIDGAALKSNR
jgi:hypothetical protein